MRQGPNGRRPRGRPNRKQHGGPSRPNSFDSSGPEGRIRGNAHQVYEKYIGLARDALSSGDRVVAETYFQHAEHYFRIVNSSTDPETGDRRPPRQEGDGRDAGARDTNDRSGDGRGANTAPGPDTADGGAGDGARQPRPADQAAQPVQPAPAARGQGPDDREGLDRVLSKEAAAPRRRAPRRAPRPAQAGNGQDQPVAVKKPVAKPQDKVDADIPAESDPDSEPAGA